MRNIPFDYDAELVVIGNCVLSESREPLGELGPQHFYSTLHSKVAQAIITLAESGRPINTVELHRYFEEHKNGITASDLAALTDGVPETKNFEHYRARLAEKLQERSVLWEANALGKAAESGESTVEILERAEQLAAHAKPAKEPKKVDRLYPDVPADAWRAHAEIYRRAVEHSTEASDNFHLFAFLTGIGSLLGRSVYTQMGRRVHPNIFLILVGEAGRARKGTALDYVLSLVEAVDPDVHVTTSVDSSSGFIQDLADAQAVQQQQRKLFGELRAILSLDEFRQFVEKAGQKATGDITPLLCKAYDLPPKLAVQTRQNPKTVSEPTLSIMAGTSPNYLQNLSLPDIEGGLGSRLTFVPGDPKPRKASPPDPDSTVLNPLKTAVKEIIDHYRERGPTRIDLSKEAKERWEQWYEKEYNPPGEDPLVMSLSERDHLTARKFALIYAALDRAERIEIDHLQAAIRMVEFLYESRFPVFAGHGLSRSAKAQQKIIKLVTQRGRLSLAKLQSLMWRDCDGIWFRRHLKALEYPGGPIRVTVLGRKSWVERGEGGAS